MDDDLSSYGQPLSTNQLFFQLLYTVSQRSCDSPCGFCLRPQLWVLAPRCFSGERFSYIHLVPPSLMFRQSQQTR